jgi:molybdopterin/thiamine biosynthesis adenylyltransferase
VPSGSACCAAAINPDVQLESYTMNITTLEGFDAFKQTLVDGSGASRVDLVLSCVDNYEARMTINQASPVLRAAVGPSCTCRIGRPVLIWQR